jgi:undecaprenyl-diphosphatase
MSLIRSLFKSFKKAFFSDEEVQKLAKKYPRISSFLRSRCDRTKFTGLPLTILGVAFFYVVMLLFGAVKGFINSDIIVSTDAQVNDLLYVFRNATAVRVFMWFTLLGNSWIVVVFAFTSSIILWLSGKKRQIFALWLVIVGSESFTSIAKLIFHRSRPVTAVYWEKSNSFPSSHATIAVAFYGFIAYLLLRKIKNKKHHFLVILFTMVLICLVGFSRLYLGVHYVSDVWTGYLVGLLWLIIGISITELAIFQKKDWWTGQKIIFKYRKIIFSSLIGTVLIFYIVFGCLYQPKFLLKLNNIAEATVLNQQNIFQDFDLPRYTETLTGNTQEPISFIIFSQDDNSFKRSMAEAGWVLADPVNPHYTWELIKYAVANKEYDTAPMTPSFWNRQVHDFGFEKSTEANTVRQRHHSRFWKTGLLTEKGENIYMGTVSLDTGIKWFVTHKISPDIDTERELLFIDLQTAGRIKNFIRVKSVPPVLGKNFSGDQFFTDGEAYFIQF